MSADNSQESGSSRRSPEQSSRTAQSEPSSRGRPASRYDRAAREALASAPADLEAQRQADRSARAEARHAAEQERQARRERNRGRAQELEDIAAIFKTPEDDKDPDQAARRKPGGDRPDAQQDGSAGDRGEKPPRDRPALEFDDDDDAGEDQRAARRKRGEARTLAELAEEHELDVKQLYAATVEIDGEDEPVSVGELKDRVKKLRDFEDREADFEDSRAEAQNEIMTARLQIDNVLARLTKVVPADQLARAFADMEFDQSARLEKARAQIQEWFPEWKDVQVKIRDRERLETVLASYGFNKFEVGAVQDARLVKFAMDAIRKCDRYDRLRAESKREKQPSRQEPSRGARPRKQSATDRAEQQAKTDPVGAVATLMGL